MSSSVLFGPDQGCSLEPVSTWLYTEGRRLHVAAQAQEGEHAMVQDLRGEGIADYYALPMIASLGTVNAMTLATSNVDGFTETDFERFKAMANLLAPLVEIIAVRRSRRFQLDRGGQSPASARRPSGHRVRPGPACGHRDPCECRLA